jgi:hypothetical protein
MNMLNQSLWGDEAFSAVAVAKSFSEMLGVVARDTAPPGYYVANWLWTRVFGFSEIGIRSMSTLMMIIMAIYAGALVKELFDDKWGAWMAAIVVFFSPFLFDFAFEGRMYAILGMFGMMSTYYFFKKNWPAYSLTAVLTLYAQHFGVFLIFAQFLWFFLENWKDWGKIWKKKRVVGVVKKLLPFLIMGGLYLPWVYPLYKQVTKVGGGGFWLAVPKIKDLLDISLRFLTGGVAEKYRTEMGVIVLALVAGKEWRKYKKELGFCLFLLFFPILLAFLMSQVMTSVFFDRYLLFGVVMGGVFLAGANRWWGKVLVMGLVVFYAYLSGVSFFNPQKRDFRGLAQIIKREIKTEDKLINYNGKAHHLWESKYYGVGAPIWSPGGPLPYWVGTAQMEENDVIYELPEPTGRLGVISSNSLGDTVLPEEWEMESYEEKGELKIIWYKRSKTVK